MHGMYVLEQAATHFQIWHTCCACSVGTGLEDAERDVIRAKLEEAGLKEGYDHEARKVRLEFPRGFLGIS